MTDLQFTNKLVSTLGYNYNYFIVFLSYLVAIISSLAAIKFVQYIKHSDKTASFVWLVCGSVAMGLGIWTMHFVGMLSLHFHHSYIGFNPILTFASLALAIFSSAIALFISSKKSSIKRNIFGGTIMGIGIASMHYIGTEAIIIPNGDIKYNTLFFTLSVFVAILGSIIAMFTVFRPSSTLFIPLKNKLCGSIVLGSTITLMHYCGMYASIFICTSVSTPEEFYTVRTNDFVASLLTLTAILVLGFAFLIAFFRRQVDGISKKLNEALKNQNVELENKVYERTRELEREIDERIRNEEKFRSTFEQTSVGIAHIDFSGNIILVNQRLCDIIEYTKDELLKLTPRHLQHPEDQLIGTKETIDLIEEKINRFVIKKRYLKKTGDAIWCQVTVSLGHESLNNERYLICVVEDITKSKQAADQILFLANHDPLTGLANRAAFSPKLQESIEHANREGCFVAVHLLDLDRFKIVNDTLGHHIGDLLIKSVADRIKNSIRETDFVARLGGDEFVIIQTHLQDPKSAEVLAQKIVSELGRKHKLDGHEVHSGVSIGITMYPGDANDPSQLLKNADMAMYKAKSMSRHTYCFYTNDLNVKLHTRKRQEENLRKAIKHKEFSLHYQPQFDITSRNIIGAEALFRSNCDSLSTLTTAEIIQLAEESGMIVPLGEWILREAITQAKKWQTPGKSFMIAVNFSTCQFKDKGFICMVNKVLRELDYDPSLLEIEITEGLLFENTEENVSILKQLKGIGVRISIDDFGTGFSTLAYLKHFPVDALKIDKSFVNNLPNNIYDKAITSSIITLAHNLKIKVVAEGVENEEQIGYLFKERCDFVQGYLLSRPITGDELTRRLSASYQ